MPGTNQAVSGSFGCTTTPNPNDEGLALTSCQLSEASREVFQLELKNAGFGGITTEILPAPEFYYAEDYHQQYLAKNPGGYCGLGGTGVSCPVGVAKSHAVAR